MSRLAAVAALLLFGCPSAQSPDRPELVVQNLAPFARDEWVQVVVPFAEGEVKGLPELHVDGRTTVWEPFGARWPDGSLRQALCLFHAELAKIGELRTHLVPGRGEEPAAYRAALPDHELEIVAKIGDRRVAAKLPEVEVLAENAARRVSVLRGRIGDTGLVAEATLEQYSGQSHAWFGIGVFFSDPARTAF